MRRLAITIVLLHLLISLVHGSAHDALRIQMSSWQNVYIYSIILILPLVAAVLIWRRRAVGFMLLFLSMLGALIFGGYYHFVLAGPDNISHLGPHAWALPFQITAFLLAITEAAGVVVALRAITRRD